MKIRLVPHTKRYVPKEKKNLFLLRTLRNTQIHCVNMLWSILMLDQAVCIVTTMLYRLNEIVTILVTI
jgi:hypothetical protein